MAEETTVDRGRSAAFAAELAALNIRKYLELHESHGDAHLRMRLQETTIATTKNIADSAVNLAIENLKVYRDA